MNIKPLKCVEYNGVDSITFSVFEPSYSSSSSSSSSSSLTCSSRDLQLSLIAPVATFVTEYWNFVVESASAADAYYEENAYRDAGEATECQQSSSGYGYVKLGCLNYNDIGFVQYYHEDCLYKATETVDGQEVEIQSGMDASLYSIPFNSCSSCIDQYTYINGDENGDAADEDEINDDSLCNRLWDESAICDEQVSN